jgi:DNA-binding transcriptional regulator YiaG
MTMNMHFGDYAPKEPLHYKLCGLDDVYLVSGYDWVPADDSTCDLVVQDIDGLHRVIADCLVRERKSLSGKEFRFLRKRLDMTQLELAIELGTTDQAIARWEKGETRVPGPADTALRFYYLAKTQEGLLAQVAAEIVRQLRERDDAPQQRMVFGETEKGWVPVAA